MNVLYKRIVTLGMVSITAMLGWIYCVLAFRDKPVYIALVSIIAVGAVFVLLNAIMDLHTAKEAARDKALKEAAAELVASVANQNDDELLRLNKAAYVQIRKQNELLQQVNASIVQLNDSTQIQMLEGIGTLKTSNEGLHKSLSEEIGKLAKIVVKYNEVNTTKLVESISSVESEISTINNNITESRNNNIEQYASQLEKLSNDLSALKQDMVSSMEKLTNELSKLQTNAVMINTSENTSNIPNVADDAVLTDDAVSADDTVAVDDVVSADDDVSADDAVSVDDAVAVDDVVSTDDDVSADDAVSVDDAVAVDDVISADDDVSADDASDSESGFDANSFFNEFGGSAKEDNNSVMSQDDIAALFAASQEAYRAKSEDDFKVEEHPDSMDQTLIDALLNSSDSEEENESIADVIPFPSKEVTPAEETVAESKTEDIAPVNDDPNRQLSPDEIAALFASAGSSNTPAKEPEPEPEPAAPVNDDPNRQLSPDEIAALFASAGSSNTPAKEPEPEPEPAAPVNDDPNRQLSPDEIAALFASMGN